MRQIRKIKTILKSKPTIEGAGVHLKRVFGYHQTKLVDPFLMLDDFHSNVPADYQAGFPWHPHRGIETITYMLHGAVEHKDSLGNQGIIQAGDVQWMTAGSGIIHQEMPRGENTGLMWGFQLWANLPAKNKMMPPRYQEIKKDEIPEYVHESGTRIKIICGALNGLRGPVKNVVIEPTFLDFSAPAGITFTHPTAEDHTVLAYVIEGQGYFGTESQNLIADGQLVIFGDGTEISIHTPDAPIRLLLITGKPLREPIAWYGPIVMNTESELRQAFEEYERGTFIKTG
ncbi:pirin family protein [candidate division KSB1 bacterium]|nr:pirin family protein [candidate division KSB1 bacterium]